MKRANALRKAAGIIQQRGQQLSAGVVGKSVQSLGVAQRRTGHVASDAERAPVIPHEPQRPDSAFKGTLLSRQRATCGRVEQRTICRFLRIISPEAQAKAEGTIRSGTERDSLISQQLAMRIFQKWSLPHGSRAKITAQAAAGTGG